MELGRGAEALCINYNSPNAGASQNHIHMHAWVQNEPYSVQAHVASCPMQADSSNPTTVSQLGTTGSEVQVHELKTYAATCLRVHSGSVSDAGAAVHALVRAAPVHNVAACGKDVFVFLREPGTEVWTINNGPMGVDDTAAGSQIDQSGSAGLGAKEALKLGSAQLLGRFVVDTMAQYDVAKRQGAIESALQRTRWRGNLDELLLAVCKR